MNHLRRRKMLLAVEDDSEDALLLREEMKAARLRYIIVRSAEEAMGVIKGNRFDAAIIDMGLPMMNGTELAKRIKDDHPKTRIFMITGSSFINLDEGQFMRVIRKPIKAETLREMII